MVDGRLLALIFAMLAIGAALDASGAVALIVEAAAPHLMGLPPFVLVWSIYLLTSVLTELVSNNAVAVVVTPIAIGLAAALGIDPRPLVSDEHAGLWAGRVPVHRFHEGGHSPEPERGASGLCADPGDLAALRSESSIAFVA